MINRLNGILRKFNKDNKGSAIVIVIMAMAFIAILGITIMWMSLANFRMKVTDQKNKQGFYTAETVFEQIKVGLQGDVSLAANSAYNVVMQNYSEWDESRRRNEFQHRFKQNLIKILSDNAPSGMPIYKIEHLTKFVDTSIGINQPGGPIRILATAAGTDTGVIATSDDAAFIVLKDINLKYTDPDDFFSEINTDIMIAVPSTSFMDTSSLPPVFKYALVAEDGLEVHDQPLDIDGSVYVGGTGICTDNTISIKDARYVVSQGPINLKKATADFRVDTLSKNGVVYAQNVNIKSGGKLDIKSNIRVQDDLTLGGQNSKVKFKGSYIGFGGNDTDSSMSSAVLINGLNATVDMKDLDKLILAGHSFVGTGSDKTYKDTATLPSDWTDFDDAKWSVVAGSSSVSLNGANADIMMGDSVAVKSNQLAYLVPDECIAVYKGRSVGGKNPMIAEEYAQFIRDYTDIISPSDSNGYVTWKWKDDFDLVSMNVESETLGGHKLGEYVSGTETFRTVFAPSNGQTLVYFYVLFDDSAAANRYASDFYAAHDEKMNAYVEAYAKDISLPDDRWTKSGVVLTDSTTSPRTTSRSGAVALTAGQEAECKDCEEKYTALCSNLTENFGELSAEEKNRNVFENLVVSENNIRSFLTAIGSDTAEFKDDDGYVTAVVTDTDASFNAWDSDGFELPHQGYVFDGSNPNIKIILSTHDVLVTADYTGIIITKGKVYKSGPVTIKGAGEDAAIKEQVMNALARPYNPVGVSEADKKRPADFFRDGPTYVAAYSAENNSGLGHIDIDTSVIYQNWIKY